MDFHSLTRKELQTLCKKNKIPANLTNVAMADTLASLDHVEGLEESLEELKSESQQLPVKAMVGSPAVPRTACRTSTRRKQVSEEPESSKIVTRTCRATRGAVAEELDQERTEIVPKTPAARSSRRAPPVSARQKTESQKEDSSVQREYSTRRSVRLLEKTMEKLNLVEDRKIQALKMDEFSMEEMANSSSLTMSGTNLQTSSEVCSEKTEDLEVSSALKSDGSSAIQMDMNNDVQAKKEDHVTEVENSKPKSELTDSVEMSDKKMDVVDGTVDDKEMESIQDEAQDLGTEDSLAAEISVEVSTDIITQEIAPKSSIKLEENESLIAKESAEHIPLHLISSCIEAENFENLSSEASAKSENLTVKSPKSDLHVTEDDYKGKFDFESESITEEENGDDSSKEETGESEALDDMSSKSPKQISEDKVKSEEKETCLVEATTFVAEDCQGKCDYESESVTEEESSDDIPEEEASDDESAESNAWDEEFTDSEIVIEDNAESEETDLEASLVDVNVTEGEVSVKSQSQFNPCHVEDASIQDSTGSGDLVDVSVVSAEEFETMTSKHLPSKSPPSLKEASPAHHMVSGSNVTTTKSPFLAFSADQLSGQFPRPTLPTPSKSSNKSHPIIQMITDVMDEHEENMAVPPVGGGEVKKNENPAGDNISMPKLHEGTSLRQLQKMLREKLQIENEKKQVGKTRIALQTLPENRLAADEPQREN